MVLSQEDQPRTHSTFREIPLKTGIPESSIVHIIRKDLQLKCFKRRRAQELTEARGELHQSREWVDGSWVMGQMGHENRMGHMGHESLGVDP